jgi:hypothetical protein
MGVQRVGDLELGQDLDYQRREWAFERAGWVVMALIVVAALLGLFGDGPLSRTTTGNEPLRLEYNRFVHRNAPERLRVSVAAAGDEVRLWVSRGYLEQVELREVSPRPDRVEPAGDRDEFVFRVARPGRPFTVIFRVEPEALGSVAGRVGVGDDAVDFRQFVYP